MNTTFKSKSIMSEASASQLGRTTDAANNTVSLANLAEGDTLLRAQVRQQVTADQRNGLLDLLKPIKTNQTGRRALRWPYHPCAFYGDSPCKRVRHIVFAVPRSPSLLPR